MDIGPPRQRPANTLPLLHHQDCITDRCPRFTIDSEHV